MKTRFVVSIASGLLWLGLVSCSTETEAELSPSSSKDILRLGPFEKGNFIPDEKPLSPEKGKDLREVALSLPIWESGWENAENWVMKYSEAGTLVDEWTNPADGAQHAVTVKRLKPSPEGRIRIEVHHPTLKIFTPSGGIYHPWVAVLERRDGGWIVKSAEKASS